MKPVDIHHIQAVFWDFDGVILDTEPLHHAALNHILNPLGIHLPWKTYQEDYIGFDDRDALKHAAATHQQDLDSEALISTKAQVFQEKLQGAKMTPYPGVMELLQGWRERGIPQLICSGALMSDIDPVLDSLNIRDMFEGFVTADQVTKSKPDPETYNKGFALASAVVPRLKRQHCMVIEDTPAGISAAKKAHLPVLAVATTHAESQLEEADWVVDSLVTLLDS